MDVIWLILILGGFIQLGWIIYDIGYDNGYNDAKGINDDTPT